MFLVVTLAGISFNLDSICDQILASPTNRVVDDLFAQFPCLIAPPLLSMSHPGLLPRRNRRRRPFEGLRLAS